MDDDALAFEAWLPSIRNVAPGAARYIQQIMDTWDDAMVTLAEQKKEIDHLNKRVEELKKWNDAQAAMLRDKWGKGDEVEDDFFFEDDYDDSDFDEDEPTQCLNCGFYSCDC